MGCSCSAGGGRPRRSRPSRRPRAAAGPDRIPGRELRDRSAAEDGGAPACLFREEDRRGHRHRDPARDGRSGERSRRAAVAARRPGRGRIAALKKAGPRSSRLPLHRSEHPAATMQPATHRDPARRATARSNPLYATSRRRPPVGSCARTRSASASCAPAAEVGVEVDEAWPQHGRGEAGGLGPLAQSLGGIAAGRIVIARDQQRGKWPMAGPAWRGARPTAPRALRRRGTAA